MTGPLVFGQQAIFDAILKQLQEQEIPFRHLMHRETSPSSIAEEIGLDVREGVKCLIVRGKKSGSHTLLCVKGHQRIDMRSVTALLKEGCALEKPEIIRERFGLEVGGIPPFGVFLGLPVYFDPAIEQCEDVICSCGPLGQSLRLRRADLIRLVGPTFAQLTETNREP